MAKFKVGDKVVGNKEASGRYLITKTGWVGTVVEIWDDGKLVVDKAEQEKFKEYCRKKIELLEGSNFDEDIFEKAWKATRKWFDF